MITIKGIAVPHGTEDGKRVKYSLLTGGKQSPREATRSDAWKTKAGLVTFKITHLARLLCHL